MSHCRFWLRARWIAVGSAVFGWGGGQGGLSLSAQTPPSGPSAEGGSSRPQATPQERRERIRTLRTWQMIVALDLNDAQSEKFFLALKRYDAEEDRLNGERDRLSASMRTMVNRPETPEKALLDTIQAIRQQDDLLREARGRFRADAATILSVRQQARLILFEQRFDLVLRNTILEVMARRGEGGWGQQPGNWGAPDPWGRSTPGGGWNPTPK